MVPVSVRYFESSEIQNLLCLSGSLAKGVRTLLVFLGGKPLLNIRFRRPEGNTLVRELELPLALL